MELSKLMRGSRDLIEVHSLRAGPSFDISPLLAMLTDCYARSEVSQKYSTLDLFNTQI